MATAQDVDRTSALVDLWRDADPDHARSVAADRRALIAEKLVAVVGTEPAAARLLKVSRSRPGQMLARAVEVRADPERLAAALAAGPIDV